jgi:hypothetical protein
MSMKNKIIASTFSLIFLLNSVAVNALVRENIPATHTENRDLTFRYKNMNTRTNPLVITLETALTDAAGERFSVVYSSANGNLRFGSADRKVTFKVPIVESDTRCNIKISGGVVPANDPLIYPVLILNDLTLIIDPQDPTPIIDDIFGNSPIGSVPGPQGPQGDAGPTGPQGPAGASGTITVSANKDINGLSTFNATGVNYITLSDSNTATTEVIETISGGTKGQILFLEMGDYVRFRVNNTGAPNTIYWSRGTTTGDIQPTSPATDLKLIQLIFNGTHWFLTGRSDN